MLLVDWLSVKYCKRAVLSVCIELTFLLSQKSYLLESLTSVLKSMPLPVTGCLTVQLFFSISFLKTNEIKQNSLAVIPGAKKRNNTIMDNNCFFSRPCIASLWSAEWGKFIVNLHRSLSWKLFIEKVKSLVAQLDNQSLNFVCLYPYYAATHLFQT